MLKKNTSNHKLSFNNIKIIQKNIKNYLFISPYEKVIKILNSIKDYISLINNSNNAIEELEWVINILTNHLLYSFKKSFYYNQNINVLDGNHKIKDFSFEVELFNKEYEMLYKKYFQIGIKNEEFAKYLSNTEKNISIVNDKKQKNYNSYMISPNKKNNSIGIFKKLKKSKNKFFSQFSVQLLKDYNQIIFGNNSITDIYFTDNNGFSSKKNENNIDNSNKNKAIRDLSFNSQNTINNYNNKNSLYNNYQICSTVNYKNKNNRNKNFSSFFDHNSDIMDSNINNNNSNNQRYDKIVSLPLIQFNLKNGTSLHKNKINKKYNLYFNHQNDNIKHYNKKSIIIEQENKKTNIPLSINTNMDLNLIFDYTKFNIFNLKDKLGLENTMPFLGKEIIKKLNIYNLLETSKLDNFLMTLSKNYQNTKALYHTSLHGVDVCYSTYLILTLLKNEDNKIINISELDIVSLIISGLSHDIGHPGLTNKFLINSKDELSIVYNDMSILENYHCSKTFQLLENDDINIFSSFSNEEFLLVRKKMIGEILSTDMSYHFKIVNDFKEYKKNKDKKLEQNQLNFIIHIADLSHNYRKFEISIKWVELLSNEFWNQGDKEKELGLPVSFLCDRNDINVPKSQVSFINTFSIPTIQELIDVNKKFEILKKNAIDNLNIWEKLEKEKRKRGWTPEKK